MFERRKIYKKSVFSHRKINDWKISHFCAAWFKDHLIRFLTNLLVE